MSILKTLMPTVAIVVGSLAVPDANAAEQAVVTELMTKALAEYPGKEVKMITVEYPPGSVDPIHRHDAHAFVYVLQGAIVMQVKGGKEVTLRPVRRSMKGRTMSTSWDEREQDRAREICSGLRQEAERTDSDC